MYIGPGLVLDARVFPVPIPKVCTSCRINIHIIKYMQVYRTKWLRSGPMLNEHACPLHAQLWSTGMIGELCFQALPHANKMRQKAGRWTGNKALAND